MCLVYPGRAADTPLLTLPMEASRGPGAESKALRYRLCGDAAEERYDSGLCTSGDAADTPGLLEEAEEEAAGERLDSALGNSITDELLGCVSAGITCLHLREEPRPPAHTPAQVRPQVYHTLSFLSEDGDTALHLALIHEHWDFIPYLLDLIHLQPSWTPYLDIQNHLGQTALHLAVIVDQPQCVCALLRGGAKAELQERAGNTPLHLAVREERVACVRELTCRAVNTRHMHVNNYAGVSALHLAVQKGSEAMVSLLLEAGADVNQRDLGAGRSPLHWAVESQCVCVVKLLLGAGAAVDQPSYAGHSPLFCALHRPSVEIRTLLTDGGGTTAGYEEEEEEVLESEEEFDDLIINGQRVL